MYLAQFTVVILCNFNVLWWFFAMYFSTIQIETSARKNDKNDKKKTSFKLSWR